MDLDQIRQQWQRTTLRVEQLEADNRRMARLLAAGRVSSAQERLAKHHTFSAFSGLLLPVLAPMLIFVLHYPLWLAICYGVAGIVLAIANFWFAQYVRYADFMSCPVAQAATEAVKVMLWQNRLTALGIVLCVPVLVSMFVMIAPEMEYIMGGLLVGLAVGLPIGIAKYFKGRGMARALKREVQNAALEE